MKDFGEEFAQRHFLREGEQAGFECGDEEGGVGFFFGEPAANLVGSGVATSSVSVVGSASGSASCSRVV